MTRGRGGEEMRRRGEERRKTEHREREGRGRKEYEKSRQGGRYRGKSGERTETWEKLYESLRKRI